eukprot:629814-Rhodomonas_salina.1
MGQFKHLNPSEPGSSRSRARAVPALRQCRRHGMRPVGPCGARFAELPRDRVLVRASSAGCAHMACTLTLTVTLLAESARLALLQLLREIVQPITARTASELVLRALRLPYGPIRHRNDEEIAFTEEARRTGLAAIDVSEDVVEVLGQALEALLRVVREGADFLASGGNRRRGPECGVNQCEPSRAAQQQIPAVSTLLPFAHGSGCQSSPVAEESLQAQGAAAVRAPRAHRTRLTPAREKGRRQHGVH